ncbi:MAG: hypothetical protein ABGY96_28780 [bacterium]
MAKNLVIIALFTLNISFGWILFSRTHPAPAETKPTTIQAIQTTDSMAIRRETPTVTAHAVNEPSALLVPTSSHGYSGFAMQLREAGYDETLVRQILGATIDRDHRSNEWMEQPTPYWVLSNREPEDDVRQELDWLGEKRQQLRDVFGDDIVDDPLFQNLFKPLEDNLSFLSSDKQIELFEFQQLSEAKTDALFIRGYTREAREDRMVEIERLSAQIREALNPEEFFEYELRESSLASSMQRSMNSFDYTEQEFRDLFSIRAENEGSEYTRSTDRTRLREQRELSSEQIKNYLPPERYAEYARSQDPVYRSLQAIGDRYGNSREEIVAVYEITTQVKTEIDNIRNMEGLSRTQRLDQQAQIQNDSYTKIENIAGKDTADSVKKNFVFSSRDRRRF